MTTANAPLTKAVLRSLLWDGGAAPAAVPVPTPMPAPAVVAAPPPHTRLVSAPRPCPPPQPEVQLDELTLAKMRLLEMRRPPASTIARIARNPVPWVVAALLVGAILGRSKIARFGAAWVGKKIVAKAFRQGAGRVASARAKPNNGRSSAWMNAVS